MYLFYIANFRKEISDQVQSFAQLVHHTVTHSHLLYEEITGFCLQNFVLNPVLNTCNNNDLLTFVRDDDAR